MPKCIEFFTIRTVDATCVLKILIHLSIKKRTIFHFEFLAFFWGGSAFVCVGELLEFNELCCINDKKKLRNRSYIYIFLPSSNHQQPNSYGTKYKLKKKPRINIRYRETLVIILFKYSFFISISQNNSVSYY